MNGFNKGRLLAEVGFVGLQLEEVCKDPAVRKAAKVAGADAKQAAASVLDLLHETAAAWQRTRTVPTARFRAGQA